MKTDLWFKPGHLKLWANPKPKNQCLLNPVVHWTINYSPTQITVVVDIDIHHTLGIITDSS